MRYLGRPTRTCGRRIRLRPAAGQRAALARRYREHIEQVKAHFCHRPDDLLVVDWEQGGGWKDLARFLGR